MYYMSANTTSTMNLDLRGGNGGNIFSTLWSSACHGPGGGGGGGNEMDMGAMMNMMSGLMENNQ